jgi:hypothetical protein
VSNKTAVKTKTDSNLENVKVQSESASTEPTVPTLKVNFKKGFEDLSRKKFREVPSDASFKTKTGVDVAILPGFTGVAKALMPSAPAEITAISRQRWLNTMCSQLGLSPEGSKRNNKNENKATTTYGSIAPTEDESRVFSSDGENYRILCWLKWPVFRTENVVFVKYDVYVLAMDNSTFDSLKKGMLLEDKNVVIL